MTNVMLLGDTHGDRGFTRGAIRYAADNGIDCVVQVGDFGFWPRTNNGRHFLKDVGKQAGESGVPFYFLDGNHEDHLVLNRHVEENRKPDQFYVPYGKYQIRYLPRGTTWEWDGVRFGAFGGAFSIDRSQRIEDSGMYGWFANEVPDRSKIEDLGKVDVLLTHDSPIVPPSMMATGWFKRDPDSTACQVAVYDALEASEASLLVHGHWHLAERYNVAGATVQALDMNAAPLYYSAVVFRTDDRRLFTIREWEYRDE
jgi:predicted phosphodiesterase